MPAIRTTVLILTAMPLLAGCGMGQLFKLSADRQKGAELVALAADMETRGDAETALALYQRAATNGSAAMQQALGDAYLRHGRIAAAIAAYKAALASDARAARAQLGLGFAQIRAGQIDEGLANLRVAAPRVDTAVAYNRLATAEAMAGDVLAAKASLQKALSLAPGDLDLKTNLALLAAVNGERDAAVAAMQEVVRTAAAQPGHERNYIMVLGLTGREDEARRLTLPGLPKRQVATILARAKSIRALRDIAARSRALGTVSSV